MGDVTDFISSTGRRSEMSLQIASLDLDRIIVVLTVLELVQEITMRSSSVSHLQVHISTSHQLS